jgi:uncharacterized RDD family membrane protein YckC
MDWYYAEDSERKGPVSEPDFNELVRTGRIRPETQVWREGWPDWRPFSATGGVTTTADGVTSARCVECSRAFPTTEMVQYQDSFVCPDCKPVFFQKVKEGIEPRREMDYAGFWIRFAAKFIDGVIVGVPGYAVQFGSMALFQDPEVATVVMLVGWLISFSLQIAYSTWMNGKFGATVGKMACGLRVVTPTGGKISYGLACGRFFAELVSAMVFYIGYIMVGFDEEKRALHDRICNTRVVRSRA